MIHLEVDLALGINIDTLLAAFLANVAELFSHVSDMTSKVIKLVLVNPTNTNLIIDKLEYYDQNYKNAC